MVALFIFLAIVAIVFLSLLIPIQVRLDIKEEIELRAQYLFFKIPILPAKQKKPKDLPANKKTDKTGNIKTLVQEKGLSGATEEILQLLKNLLEPLGNVVRRIVFRVFDLRIIVANGDAAVAAVEYGAVCALVYPFVAGLESVASVNKRNLQVQCDFETSQPVFECKIIAQLQPMYLISFVWSFLISYINQKIKDGAQYGRK